MELSPVGYHFLTDLFHKYDLDGDQALSPVEQEVCERADNMVFTLCVGHV